MLWECTTTGVCGARDGCSGIPQSFREGELGEGKESRVGETGRISKQLTLILAAVNKNKISPLRNVMISVAEGCSLAVRGLLSGARSGFWVFSLPAPDGPSPDALRELKTRLSNIMLGGWRCDCW